MDYAVGVRGQENIATLEAIEGGVLVIFREAVKREVPVMGDFERFGLGAGMQVIQNQIRSQDPDEGSDWKGGNDKKEEAIDGVIKGLDKKIARYFLEPRRIACFGKEQIIAAIDRAQKAHAEIVRLDQEGRFPGGRPPVVSLPSALG